LFRGNTVVAGITTPTVNLIGYPAPHTSKREDRCGAYIILRRGSSCQYFICHGWRLNMHQETYTDLFDIHIVRNRLACFNEMLKWIGVAWGDKQPIGDINGIISTACYINSLLLKELEDTTVRLEDEIASMRMND